MALLLKRCPYVFAIFLCAVTLHAQNAFIQPGTHELDLSEAPSVAIDVTVTTNAVLSQLSFDVIFDPFFFEFDDSQEFDDSNPRLNSSSSHQALFVPPDRVRIISIPALPEGLPNVVAVGDDVLYRFTLTAKNYGTSSLEVEPRFAFRENGQTANTGSGTGSASVVGSLGDVVFSPPAGIHPDAISLTISSAGSLSIHYTTDGSTPGGESTLYAGPFAVDAEEGQSVTVRAVALDNLGRGLFGDALFTFDSGPPGVLLSSTSQATVAGPFSVAATFSEDVSGFDASDIVVSANASMQNFVMVDDQNYTFDIVPSTQGVIHVDVPGGGAIDSTGNDNTAATTLVRTYDAPPTVVLTSPAAPTVSGPITVTVAFSESVDGFTLDDISSNAGLTDFMEVNGALYTVLVTPTVNGEFTVDIPQASAVDSFGSGNLAADQFTRTFDAPPTVSLLASVGPTVNGAVTVTATFSELVSGFLQTDVTTQNASVSNFDTTDDIVYTFTVTPDSAGAFNVNVPEGVAIDSFGSENSAAGQLNFTFDPPPTLELSSPAAARVNSAITVTATFSETVVDFDLNDIVTSNANVTNFNENSATEYTFTVTPIVDGAFTVDVPSGSATDSFGSGNIAALQFSRIFDVTRPMVLFTTGAPDPTNSELAIMATFDEDVVGFTADDLTVTNASVSNFNFSTARDFTFSLVADGDGLVTVSLAADRVLDLAGNGNMESATLSRTFDDDRPTVGVVSIVLDPTNTSPIPVSISFSEPVTGFTADDLVLDNLTIVEFDDQAVGTDFLVQLEPTLDEGTVRIDLPADRVTDLAGNGNDASASFSRSFDGIVSTPTIVANGVATGTTEASFTVTFDEATIGVDITDFAVFSADGITGTVVSSLQIGNSYLVTVNSLTGNGHFGLGIVADGTIKDELGNAFSNAVFVDDLYWLHIYQLGAAWTAISFPGPPSTTDFRTLFPAPIRGWGWEAETGQMVVVDTVEARRGYWLFSRRRQNIVVRGTIVDTAPELVSGWNFVGVSQQLDNVSDIVGLVLPVRCWDGRRIVQLDGDTLFPFHGYWMFTSGAMTLRH